MRAVVLSALGIFLVSIKIHAMNDEQLKNSKLYLNNILNSLVTKSTIWESAHLLAIKADLLRIKVKCKDPRDMLALKNEALAVFPDSLKESLNKELEKKGEYARGFAGWTTLLLATIGIGYQYGQGATLFRTCLKRGLCFCAGLMSYFYARQHSKDHQMLQRSLKEAKEKIERFESYREGLEQAFDEIMK